MVTQEQSTRPRRRLDDMPEVMSWTDTGCEVSASCLTCPLPQCKYDNPSWYQEYRRMQRDRQVWEAYKLQGMDMDRLRDQFGLSARSILRALRRGRSESGTPLGKSA